MSKKLQNELRKSRKRAQSVYHEEDTRITDDELNSAFDQDGRLIYKRRHERAPYPQKIIDKAFDLYVSGKSVEQIAHEWGISESAVKYWSETQSWFDKFTQISQLAEKNYIEQKAKQAQAERERADNRHKRIVAWMQTEVHTELLKPANNKEEVFLKLNRMKILKIATECYNTLIDKERVLIGINDEEVAKQLPDKFVYEVIGDTSESALGNQDPHKFSPDVKIPEVYSLPEATEYQAPITPPTTAPTHEPQVIHVEPVVVQKFSTVNQPVQPPPMASNDPLVNAWRQHIPGF